MKTSKGMICERWIRLSDTELKGQDFRIAGKDTLMEERVQLIAKGNEIYYIPSKDENDNKPVPFKLTDTKNKTYTFSNPQHDYPQIIAYNFVGPDSLHAWIDGMNNGKALKIDYYYKRVGK